MRNLTPAKLVMLVFVALGLIIVAYVAKTLTAREAPPPRVTTRIVPMLTGDVLPGTVITAKMLGKGPWPAEDIKDDVLLSDTGIIDRVARMPMKAAEPIHGRALYQHGELPPIKVSDGYKAATIFIRNDAGLMNGLIKPGDHVDVSFTPTAPPGDPRWNKIGAMNVTLFKGVRVLAINRDFVQTPIQATGNSVTLEISDKDIALLRLAADKGELSLSYTSDTSGSATVSVENPDRATLEELLNLPPLPAPPPPPPPPPAPPALDDPSRNTTQVYRRAGVQVNSFYNGQPASFFDWGQWYGTQNPGYGGYGRGGIPGYGPGGIDPGPRSLSLDNLYGNGGYGGSGSYSGYGPGGYGSWGGFNGAGNFTNSGAYLNGTAVPGYYSVNGAPTGPTSMNELPAARR